MPRLSIILTDTQSDELDKFLPWGTKQAVISSVIDLLIDSVKQHGPQLVGVLLAKEYNLITKVVKSNET